MAVYSDVDLILNGRVETAPLVIAEHHDTCIMRIEVTNKRVSGVVDRFFVNYPKNLAPDLKEGDYVTLKGTIRTLNKSNSDFVIEGYVYATEVEVSDTEPERYINSVRIKKAEFAKFSEYRSSYSDSDMKIAGYTVKLIRGGAKASHFRVTSWGKDADYVNANYEKAKYVNMNCRLQSYVSKRSGRLYMCLSTYNLDLLTEDRKVISDGKE